MKKYRINISITPLLKIKLDSLKEEEGTSCSEIIRRALNIFFSSKVKKSKK